MNRLEMARLIDEHVPVLSERDATEWKHNDSRLTQVTDPTGTYGFTFDNMGRLTNTTTSYAFLSGRNFTTA